MSILTALRAGVAVANTVTKPLQATVTFQRWLSDDDGYGSADYAAAVTLRAIVDWRQKQVRTKEGVLSVSRAIVTFLDVAELAAATGNNGVDDNDIIILPDGTTGPILDMAGFIDAGTGQPIATEVILG